MSKVTKTTEIPESCYRDQAPVSSNWGERHFSATYLPYGLHQMEDGFRDVIHECVSTTELEGIRSQIKKNPHLHRMIKRKLLAEVKLAERPPDLERYEDMKDYRHGWWPRRLTEAGIQHIDSAFCHRIMSDPTPEQATDLEAEIKRNEHLHQEIKDNLLANLASYVARQQLEDLHRISTDPV